MDVYDALHRVQNHKSVDLPPPAEISSLNHDEWWPALQLAVAMKVGNHSEWARAFLDRLAGVYPDKALILYERAVIAREMKDPLEAAVKAKAAYDLDGNDFRIALNYAEILIANGRWRDADEVLDATAPEGPEQKLARDSIVDLNRFIQDNPRGGALYITRMLREKYDWLSSIDVARGIEAAIADHKPFALIRLGDGDGAHFSVSDEDEARYPRLHQRVREQHTRFLLGKDSDPVFTGYNSLTKTLAAHVKEADILGVPYASWVEHEYDILSPVTIMCLMNVNRHLWQNDKIDGLQLCDQMIHIHLHHDGLINPIMRRIKSATVISCLEGLPAKIRAMFGIQDVDLIKIPSETYAPHLLGDEELNVSQHFPDAFWPTVRALSKPHDGRVFLIAAGTFGKFYAAIIKRHGGIALDLGSLVDGWMKLASRPGYGELFA